MPYKDAQKQRAYFAEYHAANRNKRLANRLWISHGLLPEEWAALWVAQDGRCYLCGEEMDAGQQLGSGNATVVVDHDHRCCPRNKSCTRCRRGLAHAKCNCAIGYADDDPDVLETIARNLRVKLAEMEDRLASKPQQLELGEAAS